MITDILWWVFASLTVLGAIGMVASRNPVASLLSLVLSFFSLAAIYVLLGAFFIAAIQVIVYAGAIMVLFLFVIMLLNLGHDYKPDFRHVGWLVAGGAATGMIGYALSSALMADGSIVDQGGAQNIEALVRSRNAVGAVAFTLYRDYLVPFEVTSILLLVAIIGAVVLAKRRI